MSPKDFSIEKRDLRFVSSSSAEVDFEHLLEISEQLRIILASQSISVRTDPLGVREHFLGLSEKVREKFLTNYTFFKAVCSSAASQGFNLIDEKRLVWLTFSKLGVRPSSELFNLINDDDYIEIYDCEGIQVFRSFEFCRLVSYSLEEVLLHSWEHLYYRESKIKTQITSAVTQLFSEAVINENLGIDTHVCEERISGDRRRFKVEMKYFAPLLGAHQKVDYLLAGSKITRVH